MKKLPLLLALFSSLLLFSQTKLKDTITRKANITLIQNGNSVNFKSENPPLIPIAGAPKPSYSYWWEMGDGHHSKEVQPKHVYKTKGEFKARLTLTNNYDNGKPPATRPKKVVVNEISDQTYKDLASIEDQNGLAIQKNCDPIPDQQMEVLLSYQNLENYVSNGKIYLFFNETQYKNNNFELVDFRTYSGEREVKENAFASHLETDYSGTYLASNEVFVSNRKYKNTTAEENLEASLAEAIKTYKNKIVLETDDLNPSETRNLFFTFKTTPEMIKDTSATITMRSIFVPNRSFKNHKIKNLEMEIVTSHDPNKMGSNGSFMNYRLVRFKRVNFKTRFQNNGEGPARTIRLETDIPDMFDKKTLKIEGLYPQCPICPKGEMLKISCLDTIVKQKQIIFTFKNIYLPGSTQKNVKEIDSTKGFVKYSMKFNNDFHKVNTKSRTAIIFDKNEPILTNYATTRFLPGISVGAKMGYNIFPNLKNSRSYFLSATLSPFKSYRFYWQLELINSANSFDLNAVSKEELTGVAVTGVKSLVRTTSTTSQNNINCEIPVLIRYNINNYIGIGAGIQSNINLSEKESLSEKIEVFEGQTDKFLLKTMESSQTNNRSFTSIKAGLLVDLTLGFARIGPSIGARYVVNSKEQFNYVQLYGIWKF